MIGVRPADDLLLAVLAKLVKVEMHQPDGRIVGGGAAASIVDMVQVARRYISRHHHCPKKPQKYGRHLLLRTFRLLPPPDRGFVAAPRIAKMPVSLCWMIGWII